MTREEFKSLWHWAMNYELRIPTRDEFMSIMYLRFKWLEAGGSFPVTEKELVFLHPKPDPPRRTSVPCTP